MLSAVFDLDQLSEGLEIKVLCSEKISFYAGKITGQISVLHELKSNLIGAKFKIYFDLCFYQLYTSIFVFFHSCYYYHCYTTTECFLILYSVVIINCPPVRLLHDSIIPKLPSTELEKQFS